MESNQPLAQFTNANFGLEVDELSPNRTTGVIGLHSTVHNQRRELVLDGRQRFLLRKRPR
jgi:acyl dehydratase